MPVADLDLLLEAALASGEIATKHFRSDPEVWDKGDGQGPVTAADLEIDQMLKAELLAARPDYGWLSEETEDGAERLSAEHVFIIDPIDGTRAFVAGRNTFAHSLAIARNGVVTAGVVHMPMRDFTYTAAMGQGAYLNGQRIVASDRAELTGAKILAAKPQFDASIWPNGPPEVERHFRSSLAYRLCLVAQGRFDGMITLRDTWEWDIAAGDLICREAGASASNRLGGALTYNNASGLQPGLMAAAPHVHAGLLAHLQG